MKGRLAFLNQWYEGVKQLARHHRAEPALAFISFIESSILPIPPDIMLIPMVQAHHARAWRYALVCTIASVLGGIAGYYLGFFFFDMLAGPLLEKLGKTEKINTFKATIEQYGAIGVFGAGLTPFPYKVITIMSGALKINFGIFVAASILSRGLRFFLVAAIVKKFGNQAEHIMKEHFGKFTLGLFAIILALWFLWRYFFAH